MILTETRPIPQASLVPASSRHSVTQGRGMSMETRMRILARRNRVLLSGVALGVTVVAMGVAGAGAAFGQAAESEGSFNFVTMLERMVIGAGTKKVAVDTPQAVTVVDQADIDAKQAETVADMFKSVPGVSMLGADRPLGEGFNIRGIGSLDSATSSGDGSKIIISVDGAPKFYEQYRMGSFFSDPELYKSVEVLRGPASSTLYGSGALGGVINFTTKDASDFIKEGKSGALRLKEQWSSNGSQILTSAILAQKVTDDLEMLAMGNFRRSDIQQLANGNDRTGSDFETWSGLVKGTYSFGENAEQKVRLSYQHWDSDANDQPYAQNGYSDVSSAFGTIDRHVVDDTVVLSYENPASDNPYLDFKGTLSYSNTAVEQSDASAQLGTIGNADYGYETFQGNIENTSEFLAGEGGGMDHYLTYGASLAYQNRTAEPLGGGIITTHPEGQQTKLGLFAQDEIVVDNGLTLIPGLRADFVHLDPSDALAGDVEPRDDVALSPKIAALYKLSDEVNVFASVAHTERVPSLDEMFQYSVSGGNVVRLPSLDLKKERSDNFEIGASTQLYDILGGENALSLKGTVFYNDIKDGIRSNPNYVSSSQTPGLPYFVNVAHMALYGFELEGAYESESLFARAALTITRGEYLEDVSASIPEGSVVDTLAQDKLVLTLGGHAMEGQVDYGTTVTFAAEPLTEVSTAAGGDGDAEAWTKVDVFASYKPLEGAFEGTAITASIENLFNADYRENLSVERSTGRTFKLTLSKQFDY